MKNKGENPAELQQSYFAKQKKCVSARGVPRTSPRGKKLSDYLKGREQMKTTDSEV